MKRILIAAIVILFSMHTKAQILAPVKWSYAAKKINKEEAVIFLKATIDNGWHIYSQNVKDGGPVKTSFTFTPSKDYTVAGKTAEPAPVTKFEKVFNMDVSYFEHAVVFQQKIKLKAGEAMIKGQLEYMTCNDKQCLPPANIDFSIAVK
ncbi:protein-disulfide reductase DsbD family protein [Mucilaginibacter sp. KACC 22773]|uniref:protein-disulfide reductase DsbD domain-containing protein n=1 Tax=Mucilaginibacter sp. KACC 22773 TaxID=3025671 RepID=UPI0023667056|nr:protein-disulfide reductase DsbD domain-containing protein [Mucilaginibacter sp. KACC 22773]WDF77171.1 protein-disulfide reductase DsbD family protein [Mucilaginibacter sp. KACC 22773]